MANYIRKAEEIILANPQILEDEVYPDIKRVYREHYKKKRFNNWSYSKNLYRRPVEEDYSMDDDYEFYSPEDAALAAVGGDAEALCNLD